MKLYYYLYLLFFQQPDHYLVVNKPEKVYVSSVGGYIQQGQRLLKDDSISFVNSRSVLRIMTADGIYEITKEKNPLAQKRQINAPLLRELKSFFIPVEVKGVLQSRAGDLSNLTEVEQYFNNYSTRDSALFIIDTLLLPLTYASFKDTSAYLFYISYGFGGDKINKRIPILKTKDRLSLVLDRRLFFIDGIDNGLERLGPVTLSYRNNQEKTDTWLSVFHLRQCRFADIRKELELVAAQTHNTAERSETLLQYLTLYYGLTDTETFIHKYLPQIKSINHQQ